MKKKVKVLIPELYSLYSFYSLKTKRNEVSFKPRVECTYVDHSWIAKRSKYFRLRLSSLSNHQNSTEQKNFQYISLERMF